MRPGANRRDHWTWERFTPERFAEIQRERGRAGGVASGTVRAAGSFEHAKPWEREGVSRATWYRRRAAGRETMRLEAISGY